MLYVSNFKKVPCFSTYRCKLDGEPDLEDFCCFQQIRGFTTPGMEKYVFLLLYKNIRYGPCCYDYRSIVGFFFKTHSRISPSFNTILIFRYWKWSRCDFFFFFGFFKNQFYIPVCHVNAFLFLVVVGWHPSSKWRKMSPWFKRNVHR